VVTDLTFAQEEEMTSWLEENELLYNKTLNAYKDYKKKMLFGSQKQLAWAKMSRSLRYGTGPLELASPG
jgi:hypothetical protein